MQGNEQHHFKPWHQMTLDEALRAVGSDEATGLSLSEIESRTEQFGPNRLANPPEKPWWKEIGGELTEPMILLLLLVAVMYGVLGELRDAIVIFVIIIAVLTIEIMNESKAKGAIKALSKLSTIKTPVIRQATYQEILGSELVPGDIVILRTGERIPADLRLLDSVNLMVDESSFTGESVPISKSNAVFPVATELGDRSNMAFSGTLVTSGKGKGVVVSTGMDTELGKIASLVKHTRERRTPLQQHMRKLSRLLVWIALAFSALIALLGMFRGTGWKETILTGLTLAFATIPEELPILITMVLGIGAFRLSKKQVIIRKLRTAETIGHVTIVATDKTGTLTENQMTVQKWFINGKWISREQWNKTEWNDLAVKISVLANDGLVAGIENGKTTFAGDPTDIAFFNEAEQTSYSVKKLQEQYQVTNEFPLDQPKNRITTVVERDQTYMSMSKGDPEQILQMCDKAIWNDEPVPLNEDTCFQIEKQITHLTSNGYRVLGLAYKEDHFNQLKNREQAESNLIFVGLAALLDPPRAEVSEAVTSLQDAGVRVLMITGDHAGTARTIGAKVGINSTEQVLLGREIETMTDDELKERLQQTAICARTTPEHKLRIVQALQQQGEVVAVTGDGVNDGPALKEAAVGIAMGKSGTDVAKESADMVLANDDFSSVALAVKEGRKLFSNLYKAIRYYLAAKVALITATLLAVVAGFAVPFAPIQMIVMELFLDLGAASSFTAERAEADIMKQTPRNATQRFMDRGMVLGIFSGGLSLAFAVLIAYSWAITSGKDVGYAQTVAFATWMIAHFILALFMRSEREPLLHLGLFSNRVMLLWIASAIGFLLFAIYFPYMRELLYLTELQLQDWLVIVGCSVIAPLWIEIGKWIKWKGNV